VLTKYAFGYRFQVVEEVGAEMFCPKIFIDKRNVLLPLVCIRNPETVSTWYPMTFEADVYQEESRRCSNGQDPGEFKFFSTSV